MLDCNIRQTVVGDWLVGEMRQWDRSTDWMQVESSFVESDGLRMFFARRLFVNVVFHCSITVFFLEQCRGARIMQVGKQETGKVAIEGGSQKITRGEEANEEDR